MNDTELSDFMKFVVDRFGLYPDHLDIDGAYGKRADAFTNEDIDKAKESSKTSSGLIAPSLISSEKLA